MKQAETYNPETILVYCKNNDVCKAVPQGSSLLEIYDLAGAPLRYPPMSARVNQRVEGLDYR
ncbi:MAG: hypothetical protein LBT76_06520, partial [Tannerella sp.]|nr:hypothetical protein [Tannerella sp.]